MPLVTGTRSPRLLARGCRARAPVRSRMVPPLLTSALAPEAAAFSAATVLRPTVPLGVSWAAFWKRLTAVTVDGPNCAVDLDAEARLAESTLQFADIRTAGAGPEGPVAEMRPCRALGHRGRCADDAATQGRGDYR